MLEISLQPDLQQSLELLLSPRLLQMLKILHLPYMELVDKITREAEENVMLEVERRDEYLEFIKYLNSDKKIRKEADFSQLPGLKEVQSITKKLEDHLLEQLEMEDLDESTRKIVHRLIENIDETGYLIDYPRIREKIMAELSISRPTVDKSLKILQSFEPEGVGARDLKECLLIQIREYNFENETLQNLLTTTVEKHLEIISQQDYSRLAKVLHLNENGAREIVNFIKNNLNPKPGIAFGEAPVPIIPSFAIEKTATGHQFINLEKRYGPIINFSKHYTKVLENPKTDEATRTFLKEKMKNAKNLLEDLEKRNETLEKIVRKIIETQDEFFEKGAAWLQPLTQKELADEFGLHPSTISRSVAEKYIQTPKGLLPLKLLCPRGPKGTTASRIKALLAEIIQQETVPLSDGQITEKLNQRGIRIDRRTVAYYRQRLKIPIASQRKG